MATKSEDIRLQLNNVRYKKGDGTLYLMAERLGWMPNTKDNFAISHKYSDIKMQKISPEGKAKIQLQIVLHTGDTTTFQFAQLEDRTAAKDALLQILPQFKGKIPKDRERKAVHLSRNTHLLQLYKDLVETKVISADDFWSQFTVDEVPSSTTVDAQIASQDIGISADFFAGIPLNGKQIKGTVNVETLWAILKTYPRVAKKHQELVPTKMTEQEFWNKFFQSRYFNRDRSKDLFTDCAKSDEKEWTSALKRGIPDPFLDLDMFNDNAYQTVSEDLPSSSSHENPDQLLIKRFNQQSIRLLNSLNAKQTSATSDVSKTGESEQTGGSEKTASEKVSNEEADKMASEQIHVPISFKANRRDWNYDDLAGHDNLGDFLDERSRVNSKMGDVDSERYTIVPQSQQPTLKATAMKDHIDGLKCWEPNAITCIAPKDATESLKNLSPSGYLMRSTNTNRLTDTVAEDLQSKLRSVYFSSNELLRHFWLCFPALEPSLENKLVKLHETLKKFESTKLQPFHDSLSRDQRNLLNHIIRGQFKLAYRKFDTWKSKRRQRGNLASK